MGIGSRPISRRTDFINLKSVSYTHPDAADDSLRVDLGGRRIIKKL